MERTFLPDYLSIKDGILHYQGINSMDLLGKYGTPLEVSYTDLINERVKDLKGLFAQSIKKNKYLGTYSYAYATKANYSSEAVVTALNNTDLIETSSNNDLGILEELHNKGILPAGYTIICNGFKDQSYFERIIPLSKVLELV